MPASMAAYADYKDVVDVQVPALRTRARARLGRTVLLERTGKGQTQDQAAAELGIVVEQIRRYEAEWRRWQRKRPGAARRTASPDPTPSSQSQHVCRDTWRAVPAPLARRCSGSRRAGHDASRSRRDSWPSGTGGGFGTRGPGRARRGRWSASGQSGVVDEDQR